MSQKQNTISYRSLARLSFLQMKRNMDKATKSGFIFCVVYFWIVEIICFFIIKDEYPTIPALVPILVCVAFTVPDFILKLIIVHDNSVMNAFLKTRPVPQEKWEHFLTISQFWKIENLEMPLIVLPLCFLFMPFLTGLCVFIAMYLISVFGGFIVMLLKHRGNYQPENAVKAGHQKTFSSAGGKHVFGLQLRSFLRSKRLKTQIIYFGIFFYFYCILYLSKEYEFAVSYMMFFLMFPVMILNQYGFAVEANCFSAIWTKPLSIRRLMNDKYWFGVLMGGIACLLYLPLCIWSNVPFLTVLSSFMFSAGFANMIILVDPYKCVPLDLFGKSFFNTQGSSGTFKGSSFITILVIFGIGGVSALLLPPWVCQVILSSLGIIGFCLHNSFFKWVEGNFMKNRYKYMEKYRTV